MPIQPARRLDAQSERRLEEPTKSVACTNGTSGRTPRSRTKKAPADAPSQADRFYARREPMDGLSARQEPTDELSARREPPTCAAQNLARPHRSSYFLPGKAAGLTMGYLVDTECNTNLVSKRIFDRLPKHIKDQCMECDTHRQMALGSRSTE